MQLLEKPLVKLNDIQQEYLNRFKEKTNNGDYQFEEVPCLCGNQNSIIISKTDRYGLPVHTHLCKNCGMMWTNPRMNEVTLNKFYNEDYRPIYVGNLQAPDVFFDEQIKRGKKIFDFIKSEISNQEKFTVFDIGCGAGGILIPFQESGFKVFGCDLGNEYLKKGREVGLTLEYGNLDSLKKYGLAKLVILSHVIEHFANPLKNLASISELLDDNGYLYIEVPGIFKIHRTYGDTLLFLQNAHLYHFSLATLTSLMSKAGFKLVKGNENINALFKKDKDIFINNHKNQLFQVLFYLYFVEINRILKITLFVDYIKKYTKIILKLIFGAKLVDHLKNKLLGEKS